MRVLLVAACLLLGFEGVAAAEERADAGTASPAPRPPPAREVVGGVGAFHPCPCSSDESGSRLPEPGLQASLRALWQPDTEIAEGRGDYSAWRGTADLRLAFNLSFRWQLAFAFMAERGAYRFSDDAATLPAGTGDIGGRYTGLGAGVETTFLLGDRLGFTVGANVRSYWMSGADLEDGLQPGLLAAVRLPLFGQELMVGASWTQGLEGDSYLLPTLGLGGGGGKGRSRWHLVARGPGATLYYDLTCNLTVGIFGGYERRDVRLSPGDRLPGGVLRERRLPLGLEVGWRLDRASALLLTVGASVWNRLTLVDADGGDVLRETTDPAPFVQLEWTVKL